VLHPKEYAPHPSVDGPLRFAIASDTERFEAAEGAEAVGFSHGDFSFVVQTLDNSAGKQLLRAEIVED